MTPLRSLLFVPASRPDRFAKALGAGASMVIVDLEDAVAPSAKASARDAVASWLDATRPVLVRVNACETPWFADDIRMCEHPGVVGVVLPKAEDASLLPSLARPWRTVMPLVESARGVGAVDQLAAARGVACLLFGALDLAADLGMQEPHEDDFTSLRLALVRASRVAGLGAPLDGVTSAIDDEATLRDDIARARRLGFAGKLCIHPRQVPVVEALFAPTATEVDWARRVKAAIDAEHGGVATVDGKMVDRPVLQRALAILAGVAR
ncbi:MAG: CoA ester lyase [Proteobacteria bacterium]|nr:CoA ester lyase [Pseudomonadota bacterium]